MTDTALLVLSFAVILGTHYACVLAILIYREIRIEYSTAKD